MDIRCKYSKFIYICIGNNLHCIRNNYACLYKSHWNVSSCFGRYTRNNNKIYIRRLCPLRK